MELKPRMNYTINYTIKSGQSKIEGKIMRCANKGITDIGVADQAPSIEKLFISTNLLRSLKGIEQFVNLKVLSISYNEIQFLSDIKYLKGLPLNTLNMEGNHITQLPFYQYHVFATVPTLMIFDGKNVSEKLRNTALSNIEYDIQHLKKMCINEIRIQELEELLKFKGEKSNSWFEQVEQSLSPKSFEYYGIDENDMEERFDRLREQAFEIRTNDTTSSLKKWTLVYEKMESNQETTIQSIISKLKISFPAQSLLQKSKLIAGMKFSGLNQEQKLGRNKKLMSNKENKNNSRIQNIDQSKGQNSLSKARLSLLPDENSKSLYDTSLQKMNDVTSSNDSLFNSTLENMTLSPTPNSEIPQPFAKSGLLQNSVDSTISSFNKQSQIKESTVGNNKKHNEIDQILMIMINRREFKIKCKYFRMLKTMKFKRTHSNSLQISKPISRQVQYRPSNYTLQGANIELLEKAQALAEDISKLQAEIELCDKENNDICEALEKSVKNERQMKSNVKKLMNEKQELTQRVQKAEARYEEDVVHYMLESRFKFGQQELQLAELEKINEQKSKDIITLKNYVSELKEKYISESNMLKQKLTSAFDVASGYRNEISILKGESPQSIRQTPPRTSDVRLPSADSSPDADDDSNTRWRRNKQVGFMLNNYNI